MDVEDGGVLGEVRGGRPPGGDGERAEPRRGAVAAEQDGEDNTPDQYPAPDGARLTRPGGPGPGAGRPAQVPCVQEAR